MCKGSWGAKTGLPKRFCEVKYFWEEEQPCVKSYPCVKQWVDKNTCCDEVKEGGNKLGKLFPPCLEERQISQEIVAHKRSCKCLMFIKQPSSNIEIPRTIPPDARCCAPSPLYTKWAGIEKKSRISCKIRLFCDFLIKTNLSFKT